MKNSFLAKRLYNPPPLTYFPHLMSRSHEPHNLENVVKWQGMEEVALDLEEEDLALNPGSMVY